MPKGRFSPTKSNLVAKLKKSMRVFLGQFFIALLAISVPHANAGTLIIRPNASEFSGIALDGMDIVSYHDPSGPTKGTAEFEVLYLGVAWRFTNVGDFQAFNSNPKIYLPAFLGYDAWLIAKGKIVRASPFFFELHKGKVYLFESNKSKQTWLANKEENINKAIDWWQSNIGEKESKLTDLYRATLFLD